MSQQHQTQEQNKNSQPQQPPQVLAPATHSANIAEVEPRDRFEQEEQFKEQEDEKIVQIPSEMFTCFFCKDLIVATIQTICGHAFCENCLSEYLLVSKECPICGLAIRQKKGAANKRLDEVIQQFCSYLGEKELQGYRERKQKHRLMKQQKRQQQKKFRAESGRAGALVDIRDDDYIWRKGRIVRTFNRVNSDQSRIKFLIVEYLETQKKEELLLNSARLAKPGQFTDRKDIPKFHRHKIESIQEPRTERKKGENVEAKEDKPQNQKPQQSQEKQKSQQNLSS